MTKHILTVAAAALLAIPTFIIAQDAPPPAGDKPAPGGPGGPGGRGGRGGFAPQTPEERVKRLVEPLGLTQEQQDKIKAIYAKSDEANKALREKGFQNLTEDDRKKMQEARKATQDEVGAVLTAEQKEKLAKLAPAGRGGPGGRRGGGPGGPGGPGGAPGGDKKPEEKK